MNFALKTLLAVLTLSQLATHSMALEGPPLAVPDTSSPRALMASCQDFISQYAALVRKRDVAGETATDQSLDQVEQKLTSCFDFSKTPLARVDDIGIENAIYLQEVLDRISLLPLSEVPDAPDVTEHKLIRWRIPGTDIIIAKATEGPAEGEWRFSAETVSQLPEFYTAVKNLPYRADAKVGQIGPLGGLYDYLVIFPEKAISKHWIDALPAWGKRVIVGEPVWKWLGMLTLHLTAIWMLVLSYRLSKRITRRRDIHTCKMHWESLLTPVVGALLLLLSDHVIDEIVGTTGKVDAINETVSGALLTLFLIWGLIALSNILAEAIICKKNIDPNSDQSSPIRMGGRTVGAILAFSILIHSAEIFGFSLLPLMAGLGVGGLAVALAIRPTLENLIGGFILFIDKPVKIGDRCRFGDQLGDIEQIGFRSTRIRTRENTLITVPNAEFSQMQLENLTNRELTLYSTVLALRYETTPDQLRYVLARIREILLAHPKITPYDLRVRFHDFGEYSLNVEVFAYTRTRDFAEYWAIREDLNLRIMDLIREAGTGFAFPSTTEYFVADEGLDRERGLAAEEQVHAWRKKGKLPFPEFDRDQS